MSTYETGPSPECTRYADELALLALGVSTGRERAEALGHLEGCPGCHADMEQLSQAADSMLEVIPGTEPPLGFEVRLAERLRASRQPVARPWRYRRLSLAFACLLAVVALGAGAGAGWLARGGKPPAAGSSSFGTGAGGVVATRSLVSDGQTLGSVTVYSAAHGRAGWMFMSLEVGSWSGKASCEIRLADGRSVLLGTFWLDHGYGAWGVSLTPGNGQIASASVVGAKGVLASAVFSRSTVSSPMRSSGYSGASGI